MNKIDQTPKEIFFRAIQLEPSEDLRGYLDSACGENESLRSQVEELLLAHQNAGRFLGEFDTSVNTESDTSSPEFVDQQIGLYKLLEVIGEGGMGTVYMAEQTEPVHRRVALKLIKTGMDTRQVVARFEAERQALAVMDHPNIAKVLDVGATESGRPYFVMELVKGKPINQFCDEQQLDTRSRLELFQQVCLGVQHAHQKGIIHRDIKPANILVALYDDRPVPKVIDFGVAKATGEKLTEKTMFTRFGQIVGTLAYMSPEQAQFNQQDIDTRSDIYSLGAVLYELLTGEPPFDREQIKKQALDETLRMIREDEPTKPSTKLSAIDQSPQNVTSRKSSTKKLGTALRGELDWIVMKSIEKDRSRRYGTANDFAADIRHYLRGEAVVAHPPSRSYRFKKFCRKYKGPMLAASLIAVALLAGIIGTTIGLMRTETQRQIAVKQSDRAVRAEREANDRANQLKHQTDELQEKAAELKQISDFQASILDQIDPAEAGKRLTNDVTEKLEAELIRAGLSEVQRAEQLEEFITQWNRLNATDAARELIKQTILEPALDEIDKQFMDQPILDAQLREVLAHRYLDLGLFDKALVLQKQVLSKYRSALGEEDRETLNAINNVGIMLARTGQPSDAEIYFREALEKKRQILGDDDPDTLKSLNNMGLILSLQNKLVEAESYLREALEKQRAIMGEDDPSTLFTINNLGNLLEKLGKLSEAESYMRQAVEAKRRVFGDDDRQTVQSVLNLGTLLAKQGNFSDAEPYLREAVERFPYLFGDMHPITAKPIIAMGAFLNNQNKLAEAEPYYREVLEKCRQIHGDDNGATQDQVRELGVLLWRQGKFIEAEPFYRESLEKSPSVFGEGHQNTLKSISNMGVLMADLGHWEEAESFTREAMEKSLIILGDENPNTLRATIFLGKVLQSQEKYTESIELLGNIKESASQVLFENKWLHGQLLSTLGIAQGALGEFVAAEANLLESQPLIAENTFLRDRDTIECTQEIVDLYTAWNAAEPDRGYLAKAVEWKRKLDELAQPPSNSDAEKEDDD